MDTYSVIQVQPVLSARAGRSRGHTGSLFSYDTPKSARIQITRLYTLAKNHQAYKILHTHVDPITLEITSEWFQ